MTQASVAERLAVLLGAGIPPAAAWGWATDEPTADVVGAMQSRGWGELAAAWLIALAVGAPLAPALRRIAHGLRDAEAAARDRAAALASPIASARLVLALPVVGLLFGLALGFDTIRTLVATPLGWICLCVGAVLMLVGAWWSRKLVSGAHRAGAEPGLGCDLIAVALGGGSSPLTALTVVEQIAAERGLRVDLAAAREVLNLSVRSGAAATELLRSAADESRRIARSDAQATAARLGVLLMLPLGLCVLPAFFAVGVVPLLATVVGATLGNPSTG